MVVLAKMQFVYQFQLLHHLQGAIDCGEAEARLFLTGTPEDLIGVKMSLSLADNIHNQGSLMGKPLPGVIKLHSVRDHLAAALRPLMLMIIICNSNYNIVL
jgi:hypothetical protein